MTISFFVSPLTQNQSTIADLVREGYEKVGKIVAPPITASRTENIGNIASVQDLSEITLQTCLDEIRALIQDNPDKDQYVFLGFGLTKYIEQIMIEFPESSVYFCRSNESAKVITTKENKKYTELSKKTGMTIETIAQDNEFCKQVLSSVVSKLGITYTLLGDLFSSEFNWINPANSQVLSDYNFVHVNKLEDTCEIAIYKPLV